MKTGFDLSRKYHDEAEKLRSIAKLQYEAGIISSIEYKKYLFSLVDKLSKQSLQVEQIHLPEIIVMNFASISLVELTDAVFCTG